MVNLDFCCVVPPPLKDGTFYMKGILEMFVNNSVICNLPVFLGV